MKRLRNYHCIQSRRHQLESALPTLSINSNDGADFGTLLEYLDDAWPVVWVLSSVKKGNHEDSRLKESLKGILGILQAYSFSPRQRATHSHFTDEKDGAQGEKVGVSEPRSGREQLNKLQWFSPLPATPFWMLRREQT